MSINTAHKTGKTTVDNNQTNASSLNVKSSVTKKDINDDEQPISSHDES